MSIYKRTKPKTSVKHPLNSIVAFRETIVLEIKDQPRRKRFLNPHPLFRIGHKQSGRDDLADRSVRGDDRHPPFALDKRTRGRGNDMLASQGVIAGGRQAFSLQQHTLCVFLERRKIRLEADIPSRRYRRVA